VKNGRVAEDLLSEHLDALYRAALRLCGGRRADAEDLMQDVALQVFRKFDELRDPAAARGWMFTILTRTHLNRLRAAGRRPEVGMDDLDEPAFERALADWDSTERPDATLERTRLTAAIAAALDGLDAELRAVVWLIDVEGFRQREAARMLEVPEGTVASRLFRARRLLREVLRVEAALIHRMKGQSA
jgi:RNA polymerase sigma-70 factor (ECF subfamily)